MTVHGDAWINDENGEDGWAQGIKCELEVEVTDADEIRLGVVLNGESNADATVYLSRAETDRLARFLAAASVTPVEVPA